MKTKYSLLAILSVAAIMSIGAVAPSLAAEDLTELQQESKDKVEKAVGVYHEKDLKERAIVCEKAQKEQEILKDKGEEAVPAIDDIAKEFC